ncbi:MAG: hypothetical protein JNG83_09245 [Opitutaceae bacterium]|nr:hypothetical protein [Opitutaceae bacterium]
MKRASSADPAASARSLWWWVAAGFLFLGLLWAALFTAARSVRIDSVPLATGGGTRP